MKVVLNGVYRELTVITLLDCGFMIVIIVKREKALMLQGQSFALHFVLSKKLAICIAVNLPITQTAKMIGETK